MQKVFVIPILEILSVTQYTIFLKEMLRNFLLTLISNHLCCICPYPIVFYNIPSPSKTGLGLQILVIENMPRACLRSPERHRNPFSYCSGKITMTTKVAAGGGARRDPQNLHTLSWHAGWYGWTVAVCRRAAGPCQGTYQVLRRWLHRYRTTLAPI